MTNNYREWLQAAKQAMESNGNDLGRWEAETLAVWLSDNCSCAYCKKSLLATATRLTLGSRSTMSCRHRNILKLTEMN
jgi:alkylhydroperoxidase family enzyme